MGFEEFQDEDEHDDLYDQPIDDDCSAIETEDTVAPVKEKLTGLAAYEAEYDEVLFLMSRICRTVVINNKNGSSNGMAGN